MQTAFLKAAIPEPFVILGKRLRPFSLGHELLLQRFENGFAIGSDRMPTIDDLVFAVWICSQPYEDAIRSIQSPLMGLRLRLWGWRIGKADLMDKFDLMLSYITEACQRPEVWSKESAGSTGREMGTPSIQFLIMSATRNGWSYRESMDMSYPLAVWLMSAEAERENRLEIVNDRERALMKAAEGMEAKLGS
jgi:hypothetical protein